MPKQPCEYLRHVLDECRFILAATSGMGKEQFLGDEVMKLAVVRGLEIIGEASKRIPDDVKLNCQSVNWRNMAGMRDRLIHDYAGVNYTLVWDVVATKIPELEKQIETLLGSGGPRV